MPVSEARSSPSPWRCSILVLASRFRASAVVTRMGPTDFIASISSLMVSSTAVYLPKVSCAAGECLGQGGRASGQGAEVVRAAFPALGHSPTRCSSKLCSLVAELGGSTSWMRQKRWSTYRAIRFEVRKRQQSRHSTAERLVYADRRGCVIGSRKVGSLGAANERGGRERVRGRCRRTACPARFPHEVSTCYRIHTACANTLARRSKLDSRRI